MRRQLNILEYALQSLLRRRKKNAALLLVYILAAGFFTSIVFLTQSLQEESETMLRDAPEVWVQKISGGRVEPIPLSIADSLKKIRGVRAVLPRLWGSYFDAPSGAIFTVTSAYGALEQIQNRPIEITEALCGSGYMETHQTAVGERFLLLDPKAKLHGFTLKAIFPPDTDILTRDLIVLHPRAARQILGIPENAAMDLAVRVTNTAESANIAAKISRMIPGLRVSTREQLQRTYVYLFNWKGGLFLFGALIPLLAFLIMAWERASGISADEKKELGILKGGGWQVEDVLWLRFWEAFTLSVSATLMGLIVGFVHIFYFDAVFLKPLFIGWSALYPKYHLTPSFSWEAVLMVLIISTVPYLTAAVIPAWRGAVTDPAEIMQNN